MNHSFSSLHPNPGWNDSQIHELTQFVPTAASETVGKHCILELYECDASKLNDEAFLRTTVTSAAKLAGATLLNLITHRFAPQGVTGLALLAESHISIHTWPESRYAAADVFTCGNHTMPERACEILIKEFCAEKYALKSFHRQAPAAINSSLRHPSSLNGVAY